MHRSLLRRCLIAPLFPFLLMSTLDSGEARLPDPPIFSAATHYPSICYLPPESGLCNSTSTETSTSSDSSSNQEIGDMQIHFYFDVISEQCYPFSTQNCGGNENRFFTQSDCQTRCRVVDQWQRII